MSRMVRSSAQAADILLELTAKGSAVLANIAKLSEEVPVLFSECRGEDSSVLFDFAYFKSAEAIEDAIGRSERLQDLDTRVKEEHLELLTRFYLCFESIERYGADLVQHVADIEEGRFIQQTLDFLLQHADTRQLLVEAVYLLGVQLLYLDHHLPGPVRERLLVSYSRYSGESSHNSHLDTVCQLLRSSGYLPGSKRPTGYPESLLARVPVPQNLVTQLIGRLRSEDLYSMLQYYPQPGERSTGLAAQSSMLYVLLFFVPQILRQETAMMREIVDKHFPDNFVISVYLGLTAWLPDAWEPYKAARAAITNTTNSTEVKQVANSRGKSLRELIPRMEQFLLEGVVTRASLLEQVPQLMSIVRESNVCLRWMLLHTCQLQPTAALHKRSRQLHELVCKEAAVEQLELFQLLLVTARLEQLVRELYTSMLEERTDSWNSLKEEAASRLLELAEVFGGAQKLHRIQPNKNLEKWLRQRGAQIKQLEVGEPAVSSRLAVQLIQALEDAADYHQLGANLQVTQYLGEVRTGLHQLVRLAGAKEDALLQLQILSDISYGWNLVRNFTGMMQEQIKSKPGIVADLRCVFIKLAGAMEGAMLRLSEAESRELVPVSQYYSTTLVNYIRNVLQVIPDTMFGLLEQLMEVEASMVELPTRLEKERVKELSQLDKRYEIASLTHQVSILSSGILALKRTLVGVVHIDPKRLLEEGIRCELVKRVSTALHTAFLFNSRSKDRVGDLKSKISAVKTVMERFRRSFEYIQDYINIAGLQLWQEEVSRIVNFAVEKEAAKFLRGNVEAFSQYQSSVVPLPELAGPPGDPSCNFMGRLARELLGVTEGSLGLYVPTAGAWFLLRPPHQEIVGSRLVRELFQGLGAPGLAGLSRLLGLMAVTIMQKLEQFMQAELQEESETGKAMKLAMDTLGPAHKMIGNPGKTYAGLSSKLTRSFQVLGQLISQLGQITALRQMFSFQLSSSSLFEAKFLRSSLEALQQSILTAALSPDVPSFPPEGESELLSEVSLHLAWLGLDSPGRQLYISAPAVPDRLPAYLSLFLLHSISRMTYSTSTGFLVSRKPGELDGQTLLLGISVFLNHYNAQVVAALFQSLHQAESSITIAGDVTEAANIQTFVRFLSRLQHQ